ncbi:hypothetical protein ISX56_30440, partial [Serratia ureilytica]|nr:hypothetical protein [Serratia ureilytica]
MKAVIPVAGLGMHMLPATKAIPKEMLPIVDKPLIQYIVNECVAAGIKEIILVTHSSKKCNRKTISITSFELEAMLELALSASPPDDLRRRLHEGKVYIPGQAERAIEHFFRKGNLIALRELALRRTADRVDDQMREFRDTQGREKVWHTRDSILLCVGHNSATRNPHDLGRIAGGSSGGSAAAVA